MQTNVTMTLTTNEWRTVTYYGCPFANIVAGNRFTCCIPKTSGTFSEITDLFSNLLKIETRDELTLREEMAVGPFHLETILERNENEYVIILNFEEERQNGEY